MNDVVDERGPLYIVTVSRRSLVPAERMVDVFDRASTMSFSVVASVRGQLERERLEQGLRRLEWRHPLLRARIMRDDQGLQFEPGAAAPIPLRELELDEQAAQAHVARSIEHREWSDEGPRAELSWLRHGALHSTLVLTFHHVTSDGSSGVLAMRDLLHALENSPSEQVPSPGQDAFFPHGHGGLVDKLRMSLMLARGMLGRSPQRLGHYTTAFDERRVILQRLRLDSDRSQRLRALAKRGGATVHGVLSASLALSVAELSQGTHLQRIVHPVDLRRFLHDGWGSRAGQPVGYYVTSVDTDHVLDAKRPLVQLAAEISHAVQRKKARGEPLLTAPLAGPMFTRRTASMGLARFRDLAEQRVLINTFSITNLGVLEQLDVDNQYAALTVDDLYFVAAGSVLCTLGASASSFRDELSFQLTTVAPVVDDKTARSLFERTCARIESFVSS